MAAIPKIVTALCDRERLYIFGKSVKDEWLLKIFRLRPIELNDYGSNSICAIIHEIYINKEVDRMRHDGKRTVGL